MAIFGAGYRAEGDPNLLQYSDDPNDATYTEKGRGVFIVRIDGRHRAGAPAQIQGDAIFDDMKYAIPAEPAVIDTDFDGFADRGLRRRPGRPDLEVGPLGDRRDPGRHRADLGLAGGRALRAPSVTVAEEAASTT